jgi:predicted nucleotidyltransferase
VTSEADPLRHLTPVERDCLLRYRTILCERLGDGLERLVLFGSAARGDMWGSGSPMHSDIDLLVVTVEPVPEQLQEELVNETYPLYLECGRQIGPQFRTEAELRQPDGERAAVFAANVARDGIRVWHRDSGG